MSSAPQEPTSGLDALLENRRAFLAFLERRVGSRETAEDLLQDAFGKAVGRADSLDQHESVIAWFYRVLRNAAVDHYRRSAAAARGLERLAGELATVVPGSEVHGEVCACVARLAASLKPEYAEALRRVDVDEVPVKDFASERRLTPGNAAVRVFRARQALRKAVTESCGACAEHGCRDCGCRSL